MLERPQHLSAEEVLAAVRKRGGHISKATIYNTLGLFAERGLVRAVVVDPTRVFYDSTVAPHHHFFDETTHALTDIPAKGVRVEGLPAAPSGTESTGVDVVVRVRPKRR